MTDRFSLVKFDLSNALQPKARETVFCKTLVVGNAIAAYVAVLAILQAGEQVCWVQNDSGAGAPSLPPAAPNPEPRSRFSWRLGRRITPWEAAYVMSQTQTGYWANRPAVKSLPNPSATVSSSDLDRSLTPADPFAGWTLQQAIAPYLQSRQLLLVPRGKPQRVLYSEHRGQRRVIQVMFQDEMTQTPFTIHAKLTLDATCQGDLQHLLAQTAAAPMPREWILTADALALESRGQGRGRFFEDAIALLMGPSSMALGQTRPFSVPLRAMVVENTDGLLCVSPSSDAVLLAPWLSHRRAQWTLGEAMGHVAATAAQAGGLQQLRKKPHWQWHLQQRLVQQGIPLFAFDDVPLTDPDFEAIQMAAIAHVVRTMRDRDLSFRPETPVTRAVLASALMRLPEGETGTTPATSSSNLAAPDLSATHWAWEAMTWAISRKLMSPTAGGGFAPSQVVLQRELWAVVRSLYPSQFPLSVEEISPERPARRRHLSRALYPVLRHRYSL